MTRDARHRLAVQVDREKADAIEQLTQMGAEILRREDRYGETRSGWWLDGVWLAPAHDPVAALMVAKGF